MVESIDTGYIGPYGQPIHAVIGNTAKDGSGTWLYPLVNADGKLIVAFSSSPYGALGATTWVVADNAHASQLAYAVALEADGYPVWECDYTADEVQIQAAIDAIPTLL
jgi:hypothetical protein